MPKKTAIILLILSPLLLVRWGWQSHRFINAAAVDHLPPEMSFFQDHRDYLSEHSIDPDTDALPGYYHYIDIDAYPEFFAGTLPHTWQAMLDLYGQNTMEDNGIVPWVIEWWKNDLQTLMENGDWAAVWQTAAELGHYVGDSHQALHLTLNYNGGSTGNYGIHSRYETTMINPHLDDIVLPDSMANYWPNPLDSVFNYIDQIYPVVALVMTADDAATAADAGHGSTYYNTLWAALGDTTIWTLNKAVMDLASVWYTAWVDAGNPYPAGLGTEPEPVTPEAYVLTVYPNPFNAWTNIKLQLNTSDAVNIRVLDIQGRVVTTLAHLTDAPGKYHYTWNGTHLNNQPLGSGVYFIQASSQHGSQLQKVTILK